MSITHPRGLGATVLGAALLCTGCGGMASAPADAMVEDVAALARQSLSQIDGELDLAGLQAPVEVVRDHWGIPHIYAQNQDDLFFAQGYVMAQDRLWQMEMWRRWREGRLAEIFGPAAFAYDQKTRLMMHRGPFDDTEWTSYHPDGQRIFTAYANGVNAFIDRNADNLPVEFKLTGVEPGRWTAETVVRRWTALSFPSARAHATDEIRLALDVVRLGAEEANRRRAPDPWDDLVVPEGLDVSLITPELLESMRAGDGDPLVPGRLPPLEIVDEYRHLVSGPPTVARQALDPFFEVGSNNWVVSGALSPTGVPILANDPHRRLENPSLRYYVHLNAPGWNVIGAGEPPFVGVNVGHNERMAWGFTFAGADMNDVFVEEMHPEDPLLVRYREEWESIRVVREEIPVKGEAPRAVELKFSRHGPIVYEDIENRRAYAVRSVIHEPGTAPYLGSFQMAQAASCADFFDRAMSWKVPSHSLICGDADGNIAFQASALTPDRDGWNGRLPVPGTGEYEWRGFRSDLPRELNPERGWVGSANNNIHPPDYDGRPVMYHSQSGVEFSRIARIRQLLRPDTQYSIEDHRRIQLDAYSLRAEADIPVFKGWTAGDAEVERAREMVATWDAVLDKDSAAAAMYVTWRGVADRAAYDPDTPTSQRQTLVEDGLARALERLTAELGADRSEWRYGRTTLSPFPHALVPAFDLPTIERSGGFGTVAATGVSFRHVLDPSNWDRSIFTITPGQSGQPESPFYGSLLERWADDQYFPLVYTRPAVEEQAAHQLTLRP